MQRPDEAPRGEGVHVHLGRRGGLGVEQRDDVVQPELLPDDRAALEDGTLARPEPVEAGGKQRLDGLRQRALGEAALQRQREELFEEERVSLRRLDDARALIGLEDVPPSPSSSASVSSVDERVELDPVRVRPPSRNDGRSSRSSSRARQTTEIAPVPLSARCSTSSRKVGSAQWTSSKTRTSGRSRAVASQNWRKSQAISGAGGGVSASSAARTASRSSLSSARSRTSRNGQYVMPSPYERQRPQRDGHALRAPRQLGSKA